MAYIKLLKRLSFFNHDLIKTKSTIAQGNLKMHLFKMTCVSVHYVLGIKPKKNKKRPNYAQTFRLLDTLMWYLIHVTAMNSGVKSLLDLRGTSLCICVGLKQVWQLV